MLKGKLGESDKYRGDTTKDKMMHPDPTREPI